MNTGTPVMGEEKMTIEQAAKIAPNTDAFEAAVEAASDACAANPKDKDAAKVLLFLLQRNDDFCMSAVY